MRSTSIRNKIDTLRTPGRNHTAKRGVVILEFILVFPILWILFLAIFEFGILLLITQNVTSAAIEGSRHGAQFCATPGSIAECVQEFLAVHEITFDTTQFGGSGDAYGNARVVIQYGPLTVDRPDAALLESMTFHFGNTDIPCTSLPTPGEDLIRVTVCAPVTDPTGCKPVPDFLSYFGFSLQDCTFEIRSLANME